MINVFPVKQLGNPGGEGKFNCIKSLIYTSINTNGIKINKKIIVLTIIIKIPIGNVNIL